jgi:serine protease Do
VVSLAFLAGCTLAPDEQPGERAENVAQQAPAPSARVPENEPVARVASQVAPSVVQVNVQGVQETPFGMQEGEGLGSGVIYRRDGFVITNNHVVEGASEVNIAFADGTTSKAK